MKTDRYQLLAALVRAFFDAYTSGIIDCAEATQGDKRAPKNVKHILLNHYERIAPAFFEGLFFPLVAMNFSYEEIEEIVRQAQQQGCNMQELVHQACGSEALYEAMVAEYRRNFTALLGGCCPTVGEHLQTYTRGEAAEPFDTDRAIELTTRVVMHAYAGGLRVGGEKAPHFRQVTLYRLLLDAMNALCLDHVADFSDCQDDLTAMFIKVCGSAHGFSVMTQEMDRTHHEIIG